MFLEEGIRPDERAAYALGALYRQYGYARYKMSKFEEYDLYARCKDFLVSDGIITFTDTGGRLMALKPDVTLSIIRNTRDDVPGVQKVYYNENVYRVSRGTRAFREIPQAGLECIGELRLYDTCEVVALAIRSLRLISDRSVLDISHMGYLSALMDEVDAPEEEKGALVKAISRKSVHEIDEICGRRGVAGGTRDAIVALTASYPDAWRALDALKGAARGKRMVSAVQEMEDVCRAMADAGLADGLNIDFAVANDMSYYSGIVFRGFVEGVPDGVLSGGRYDKLMEKMGRAAGAIGFAVYLDALERLNAAERSTDADVLLLYGEEDAASAVLAEVDRLTGAGQSVLAARDVPEGMRFGAVRRLGEGAGA